MRLSSSGNDVTLTSMEESDAYGKSKNVLNELLQFYIRLVVFKRLTPLVIYSSFCDTPVIALCSHTRGIIPLGKAHVTAPNGAAVTAACGDPSSWDACLAGLEGLYGLVGRDLQRIPSPALRHRLPYARLACRCGRYPSRDVPALARLAHL